ncbi:MAG: tetratricopeptide repeat protein [Akkermansiaceae bacterium]|jgi:tetratricopeptide (TPR) repeat protein|nr:tetratricopeptide repeat protein [Akkermansiaceae bacterium]
MPRRLSFPLSLCIPCLLLGSLPHLHAQAPLRAGVVDELQNDPGNDFFQRGVNLYNSAQEAVDFETRRRYYLNAADKLAAYLNEFPNHANAEPALWYLGNSYYQAGDKEEAKRIFASLINRFRQGKYATAAAYTLAADHYNLREYANAAPLFERFAQNSTKPGDAARGYLYAGNCYRQLGREREAIASYNRVVADPHGLVFRAQAQIYIGYMESASGKLKEALATFSEVANSAAVAKYRGEAALQAAIIATKLGQTDTAEKFLRFILDSPGMEEFRPDAQIALMENYYTRKEYVTVIDIFNKNTLKAEGEREALRLHIAAKALMKLKNPTKAAELFREVERLADPDGDLAFSAAYYRLNCFFQIEGKFVIDQVDAFLQLYSKARPDDKRIHTALLIKAETQFAANEINEAAKTYSKIDPTLLSDSNRPGFLYQRGWCLAEAGDHQGAIRSLTEFINANPEDARIFPAIVKRARAYKEVGESAKAVADYDRLTTDDAVPEDLSSIAWLESARVRREEGNIENMLIRYKALLAKVDDLTDNLKAEANYWIGWGMVKNNAPKEAAPFLNLARELRPEAFAKHAGLLLCLSHFAAQDPKGLTEEIDLAITGKYEEEIPDQAIQWAGMQSFNSGSYEQAARFLELVADTEEPRATQKEIWRYLAKARIEIGKFADALPAIANVLDVEENAAWKADALLDRARALLGLGRHAESRKAADEAMELRPQGRTAAYLRIISGDLFIHEENLGRAAAEYLNVINFHEDEDLKPLALYKLIKVLETQGNAAEAAKYRTQLANDFPNWKAPEGE